jgi:hypothetical protein
MTEPIDFDEPIFCYSRTQALADGVLVDCSTLAREVGIRVPVAMTHAAWAQCVAMTPAAERAGNDESGRAWDVVWTLSIALCAWREGVTEVPFEVRCVTTSTCPSVMRLRAVIGPGDTADTVITVMLPGES